MKEKEIYRISSELFDNRCAICGNNQIHMHHIRYGGLYGGRKTYIGNIIPLCKTHHDLVHTNKDKYMSILIEIINKKLEENNYEY